MGFVIVVSIYANLTWAANSATYAVTCTIPAVPGVNAPLLEEKTVRTEMDTGVQKEIKNQQEETKVESPATIQQDSEKEMRLADGKAKSVIVQTIYSR